MRKFIVITLLIIAFLFAPISNAYNINRNDTIYIGGQAVGIKLDCGVNVVGTYGIYLDGEIVKPWENIINENDKIIEYDNSEINCYNDLVKALRKSNGSKANITVLRNNEKLSFEITPCVDKDKLSLGLYIKDSILGVGTLTYYIKEAGIFGSLGHKIGDLDYTTGEIYEAKVDSIVLPRNNQAGEKKATIYGKSIGYITENNESGVQGTTKGSFDYSNMTRLHFKLKEEINLGEAEIWTVIDGTKIEKFKININFSEKQEANEIKGISFEVVDNELIKKCGGIIQGMSGSPIVQDNKLIGAVTHVCTADAKKGFGIYLEWMLEDMDVFIE